MTRNRWLITGLLLVAVLALATKVFSFDVSPKTAPKALAGDGVPVSCPEGTVPVIRDGKDGPIVSCATPTPMPAAPTVAVPTPTVAAPTQTPVVTTQLGECPSPEVLSKMLVTQQADGSTDGPAFRSIGTPLWLNPGADRDKDDVCVFSYNMNRVGGKSFIKFAVLPGIRATVNERDGKVRVWKGQTGLVAEGSAATVRLLDDPRTGKAIYGTNHRFRDDCALLANEVGFTTIEAEKGGFTSEHALGNLQCDRAINPRAAVGANGSSSSATSMNANSAIKLLVKNEADQSTVSCRQDQGAFVCEAKRGPVTLTHPGGGATIDYWSGNPEPSNANGCQVKVNGPTRSVTCQTPGATIVDDHFTFRP